MTMDKKKKESFLFEKLYVSSLILLFLKGYNFFYFWNIHVILFLSFNILCGTLLFLYKPCLQQNFQSVVQLGLLSVIYILISFGGYNINGIIVNVMYGFVFYFFLLTSASIKKTALNGITKVYAVILTITFVFYVLIVIAKIPFPYQKITFNAGQYEFNNYRVLLERINGDFSIFFVRFNSLFLEPGHIGVIAVLVLTANDFDLRKKENILILICAICTLSLATYVLLVFVVFYKNLTVKRFKYLVLIGIIFIALFIYFAMKGEGFFYERIVSRLMYRDGQLVGNNRVSSKFDSFYNSFFQTDRCYLGYGAYYSDLNLGPAAGYKAYVVQFGIVGMILIVLLYFFISFKKNRSVSLLFLVWFLAFLQAAYPLTPTQFIVFTAGVSVIESKGRKLKHDSSC